MRLRISLLETLEIDMGVNLRRGQRSMAKQLLHEPQVCTVRE